MSRELWRSASPSEPIGDPTHARFERQAAIDRWVQASGGAMRAVYEAHGDGTALLSFATGSWTRERLDTPDVEQGVAAISAGVAAVARANLEPACSRLLWATRRERLDESALGGAEHYAILALATAKRSSDREAAACVREAIRFVCAGRARDEDARHLAFCRLASHATRRLPNFASLVGCHFPFWSFPFAFRWDERAPDAGRGKLGLAEAVDDDTVRGVLSLAYRSGQTRVDIADAIERCACTIRRVAPGGLECARACGAVSELARDLRSSWAVRDATCPRDVVERVVPRTLALAFVRGPGGAERAERRTNLALVPVLWARWPALLPLRAAHRAFRANRSAPIHAAA